MQDDFSGSNTPSSVFNERSALLSDGAHDRAERGQYLNPTEEGHQKPLPIGNDIFILTMYSSVNVQSQMH